MLKIADDTKYLRLNVETLDRAKLLAYVITISTREPTHTNLTQVISATRRNLSPARAEQAAQQTAILYV